MKFKVGDQVKIISGDCLGREGIIDVVVEPYGKPQYTVYFRDKTWIPCQEDEIEFMEGEEK